MADGFAPGKDVVAVRQVSSTEWETVDEIRYSANHQSFTVPVGQRTDFASTPRVLVWLIPRYGKYTLPAILHDHLWRQEIPLGTVTYREADGILRQAMRLRGVPFVTRWSMWAAVRWGSLTRSGGAHEWWRDAPRVVAISLPAVAVVAVPVLAVSSALLLLLLCELAFWPFLAVSRVLRHRAGQDPKRVNAPAVSLRV